MWPWEHLAVGYLCFSAYVHLRYRQSPGARATVVLAVATQLPDLVDKPLAWTFAVLPSGTSLAHSVLVAVPVVAAAWLVAARVGAPEMGAALATGWFSHLLGDVAFNAVAGSGFSVGVLLWPVVPAVGGARVDFLTMVATLFADFTAFLATPRGRLYLAVDGLLFAAAAVIWFLDGRPGLPDVWSRMRSA